MWAVSYLQEHGYDDEHSNAGHDAAVVGENCLKAAPVPDVQLLSAVVIVVVGRVICHVMLDAGPWGARVTAAEGDAVHQVLSLHITEYTTAGQRQF